MSTEQIIEGNKLIAEFDGWTLLEGREALRYYKHPKYSLIHTPDKWQYHTSWDWLMPVVEKIGRLSPYIIHENGMRISDAGITYKSNVSTKDAVWNACILYIKWYNKEQKVQASVASKA